MISWKLGNFVTRREAQYAAMRNVDKKCEICNNVLFFDKTDNTMFRGCEMNVIRMLVELLNSSRIATYFFIVFAGILGVLGDTLLNQAAKVQRPILLIPALFFLNILSLMLYCLFFKQEMGWTVVVLLLVNIILVVAVGRGIFHEKINTWTLCGVILACVAIVLMEIGQRK